MAAVGNPLRGRAQVANAVAIVGETDGVAAAGGWGVEQDVAVDPLDRRAGQAQVALVDAPRAAGHLLPERREAGRRPGPRRDAGVRRPDAGRPRRTGIGHLLAGVDRSEEHTSE